MSSTAPRSVVIAAGVAIFAAVVVVVACLALAVVNRYLVNDDYTVLYTAWLESTGLVAGKDFAVGSANVFVDALRPIFAHTHESWLPLYLGRASLVVTLAIVGILAFRVTADLFGASPRPRGEVPFAALFAPLCAVAPAGVLARSLDLRPDLFAVALLLGAAHVALTRRTRIPWLVVAGALTGLACFDRFKVAAFAPWIVAVALADVLPRLDVTAIARRTGALAIGAVVGLGTGALVTVLLGGDVRGDFALTRDLAPLVLDFASATSRALQLRTLTASLLDDAPLWIFLVIGLVALVVTVRRQSAPERIERFGLVVAAVAFVFFHAAFHSYNLVVLLPLLAPVAAAGAAVVVAAMARHSRGWAAAVSVVFVLVMPAWSFRQLQYCAVQSVAAQAGLQRFLDEFTPPDAPVFALDGVGLFRPSTFHWRLSQRTLPAYKAGAFSVGAEINAQKPFVVVESYRVPDWLTADDARLIAEHYVEITPMVMVPGKLVLEATRTWTVWRAGSYDVLADRGARCTLDDKHVSDGDVVDLTASEHTLRAERGSCTVRWSFPVAAAASLPRPFTTRFLLTPEDKLPDFPGTP